MGRVSEVRVHAHDLEGSGVIDPSGLNPVRRDRDSDSGKAAPSSEKAMEDTDAVGVRAHDLAAIVNPKGLSRARVRDINGGNGALLSAQASRQEY